jgi:hypothetical protein
MKEEQYNNGISQRFHEAEFKKQMAAFNAAPVKSIAVSV